MVIHILERKRQPGTPWIERPRIRKTIHLGHGIGHAGAGRIKPLLQPNWK